MHNWYRVSRLSEWTKRSMNRSPIYFLLKKILTCSLLVFSGFCSVVHSQISIQTDVAAKTVAAEPNPLPLSKTVETSYLPLTLKYVADLNLSGVAGMGGSIYVGPFGVLLMDRTGKFYRVQAGAVTELGFRTPSRYELFLTEYPADKVVAGVINATSFAYDSNSKKIYAAHNQYLGNDRIRMIVSSIGFDANASKFTGDGNWKTVFEGDPIGGETRGTDASAGKLLLVGSELYLTTGFPGHEDAKGVREVIEGGSLTQTPPQNIKSLHSKIIKISLKDYSFEIFALGQRNSQGMVLTSSDEILITDHGPQGGDEINRLRRSANYGHPIETFGTRYGTYDYAWPESLTNQIPREQKFELPVFAFVPSVAINPIIEIKSFHQRLAGDLLVGSLKAQSLYRLKYVDGRVIFSEPIWIGHRIRDIYEYKNKIYLLTDDPHLISLEVNEEKLKTNKTKDDKYFLSKTMQNKCMGCHSFDPTQPSSMAPKLSNVIGKKIGTDSYEHYSSAFRNSNLIWTNENLIQFLKSPSTVVPGTAMPTINLSISEIEEIVGIVSTYK